MANGQKGRRCATSESAEKYRGFPGPAVSFYRYSLMSSGRRENGDAIDKPAHCSQMRAIPQSSGSSGDETGRQRREFVYKSARAGLRMMEGDTR